MTDEIPTEVSELDSLRIENLNLKFERAKAALEAATVELRRALDDAGKRYDFDPATGEGFDFQTRKISRHSK